MVLNCIFCNFNSLGGISSPKFETSLNQPIMNRIVLILVALVTCFAYADADAQSFHRHKRLHQSAGIGGHMALAEAPKTDVQWINPLTGEQFTYNLSVGGGSVYAGVLEYSVRYNFVDAPTGNFSIGIGASPKAGAGIGYNFYDTKNFQAELDALDPADANYLDQLNALKIESTGLGVYGNCPILISFNFGHGSTYYDLKNVGFFLGVGGDINFVMVPNQNWLDYGPAGEFGVRFYAARFSWTIKASGGYHLNAASAPTINAETGEIGVGGANVLHGGLSLAMNLGAY